MNGPEHYAAAEELLARVSDRDVEIHLGNATIAAAQVHATLALAAAQAEPLVQQWHGGEDTKVIRAWVEVTS